MRITALLSWYDESPLWLGEMVESLTKAGVSHLCAIDGAYGLYPNAAARSHPVQSAALTKACDEAGITLSLHLPTQPWATEMDKRTALFRMGDETRADWFLVIDADELLTTVPKDFHQRLALTDCDSGAVVFVQPHPQAETTRFPIRCLFRAIPGITVAGNHYTYRTPDGTKLWGQGRLPTCAEFPDLHIEHRTHFRQTQRRADALAYYKARDELGIEVGKCDRCGHDAVREIPANWEVKTEGRLTSDWLPVCADCEPTVKAENRRALQAQGLDPDTVQVSFDRGQRMSETLRFEEAA